MPASLSDEAIYDIVAKAVASYETATSVRPPSGAERGAFDLAYEILIDCACGSADVYNITPADMKRIKEVVTAFKEGTEGDAGASVSAETCKHYRRTVRDIRKRIEKLFGDQPQPAPVGLDPRDVLQINDRQFTVQQLSRKGWSYAQMYEHGIPVKLHSVSFEDFHLTKARALGVKASETPQASPLTAAHTLKTAADLVGGDRNATHGDKTETHAGIASLWSAYLGVEITARQVALMMCLLKIARTKSGKFNEDDYIDLAGYAGIAGEINAGEKS